MEQWEGIYKKNAPRLIGICRRYVKDIQLAEDLMHNAFMTAMSKFDTYSNKGSFEGWLNAITVNTALQYFRSKKNDAISISESIENHSEFEEESEESDETKQKIIEKASFSKEELLEVIDLLPEHHKLVFNLYVMDGYKHKDIGSMLNISPGTSKSHLARARKKIQELLFSKSNDNNRKKGFFFLLLAPKEDYIDKMYKNTLSSYEIQPKKPLDFKNVDQFINTLQHKSLWQKIISNKILISSCTLISLVVIAVIVTQQNTNVDKTNNKEALPFKTEVNNTTEAPTENINTVPDNPSPLLRNEKQVLEPVETIGKTERMNTSNKKEEQKTVVVHKTFIQRDTVVKTVAVPK